MKQIFGKLFKNRDLQKFYALTRDKKDPSEVFMLLELAMAKDFDTYNKYIRSKGIEEQLIIMDNMYANGRIMKEYYFSKIVLTPFTKDLPIPEMKQINLRLSHLYYKWFGYAIGNFCIIDESQWDEFFSQYGEYYRNNWKSDLFDYLLSLLFTPTAFNYSKIYRKTMKDASEYIQKTGFPKEMADYIDAHRIVMKKLSFLTNDKEMNKLFQNLAYDFFNNTDEHVLPSIIPFLTDFASWEDKLEFEKVAIRDKINRLVELKLKKEPDYINVLFDVLKSRCKKVEALDIALSILTPNIKSFKDLSLKGLKSFTQLLLIHNNTPKHIKGDYWDTIDYTMDKFPIDIELGKQLIKLVYKKGLCPRKIEKKINNYLSHLSKTLDNNVYNIPNEKLHDAIEIGLRVGNLNTKMLSHLLENPHKTQERSYLALMITVAKFYTWHNDFQDLEFWKKFIEFIHKPAALNQLSKTDIKSFMMTCVLLKEKEMLDASDLFDKGFWNNLESLSEKFFDYNGYPALDFTEKFFGEKGVEDVIRVSKDYWFLPLVIPSLKLAFIDLSRDSYYSNTLAAILRSKGWKIANIASHNQLNTLESEVEIAKKLEKIYKLIREEKKAKEEEKKNIKERANREDELKQNKVTKNEADIRGKIQRKEMK